MRKKVLVCIPSVVVANTYFVQDRSFEALKAKYDVRICADSGAGGKGVGEDYFKQKGFECFSYRASDKRLRFWEFGVFLSLLGGRKYSTTCESMYRFSIHGKESAFRLLKRSFFERLTRSERLTRLIIGVVEWYAGYNEGLEREFDSWKPDLVITMLCGFSHIQTDVIKSARRRGVRSFGIQYSWDSISTWGLMPLTTDYMGVWGYQSRVFAESMHHMHPARVINLGTAMGDALRSQALPRQQILDRLKIPGGKKVIFFPGSIWGYNEVGMLKVLEQAIERGVLKDTCVFYRPHPYRHCPKGDGDFFAAGFRNVVMDPALVEEYQLATRGDGYFRLRDGANHNHEHMRDILTVVDVVVAPISTVMLQAAMMGVPALGVIYVDQANLRFGKRYMNHDCRLLRGMPGVKFCTASKDLPNDCFELLRFAQNPVNRDVLREYARYAVQGDPYSFGERLAFAVGAILQPEAPSLFSFLSSPMYEKTGEVFSE